MVFTKNGGAYSSPCLWQSLQPVATCHIHTPYSYMDHFPPQMHSDERTPPQRGGERQKFVAILLVLINLALKMTTSWRWLLPMMGERKISTFGAVHRCPEDTVAGHAEASWRTGCVARRKSSTWSYMYRVVCINLVPSIFNLKSLINMTLNSIKDTSILQSHNKHV